MKRETIAVRAGLAGNEASGDVAQAIHLSTTFKHGPAYEDIYGYTYARDTNPNVAALEAGLAAIEQGTSAIAFASGVAAGAAYLQLLPAGCRVLFHHDTYLDFKKLAATLMPRWDLKADFVDMTDLTALNVALIQGADLVWFETPSNPQLTIVDIEAVCDAAHKAGAKVMVDGTFATPILQSPLALGADAVLHATTKYIGGHSDAQGGVVVLKTDEDDERLRNIRRLTGGILSPFSAWLSTRGLQTLSLRVERQSAHAHKVAEALVENPAVACVHYPGIKTAPGFAIAQKQMRASGAIVSFDVKGGAGAAIKTASRVKLFTTATSVGGVESLLEHRPSVEGPHTQTPEGLLRLSIGLEHPDDLIDDLTEALSGI